MAAADVLPQLSPITDVTMGEDEIICCSEDTVVIVPQALQYQVLLRNMALLRVIAHSADERAVKPTIYPTGNHHGGNVMTFLVPPGIKWVMDDGILSMLQPPPSPPNAHNAKKRAKAARNTELLGRYLLQRGFPLIGKGRYTLAFLITENKVAKVARYCQSVDHIKYQHHRRERNMDVRHYQDHPAAFACTTYHSVMPVLPDSNSSSWFAYCAWRHDLYVQELVTPLARAPDFLSPSFSETYGNWRRVLQMRAANPLTPFNQWGLTDSNMLVCYDYH